MSVIDFAVRLFGRSARAKRLFAELGVPFNRALGIRIVKVAPDSSEVVLRLPVRRRNRNVAGTIHGVAILALAETVHGVAVLWQFSPAAHRMFTKRAELRFLSPARGELRTSFSLTPETRAEIARSLDATGRSEFTLDASVTDASGAEVASLSATYVIRRTAS